MVFMAAEQPNPLIPGLTELILGGTAFLIVFFTLGRLLLPRIQKILEQRTEAIEGGLRRAEAAQAEAAEVLEQYRGQLAEARQEAARLREQAKEEGTQIIAEMREQAQAEAARITAAAGAQLDAERRAAMVQLRGEVAGWATELASRIVGESLDNDARQSRVVERFLTELEAVPTAAGRDS